MPPLHTAAGWQPRHLADRLEQSRTCAQATSSESHYPCSRTPRRASKLQSPQAMAKSPVRRAFFILFIAAAVIAALLLLAQDQVTLQIHSAVDAAEPRHTNYIAGLL